MTRFPPTAAAALLALAGLGTPAAAESSCVSCHRDLRAPGYVAHSFPDWERSAHAQAGVDCEACHGGDPTAADKAKAHAGVRPSTDKDSPTYYTRIPETCGTCHRAELTAFRSSAHDKELRRTGRGPNCVTCHGAMAERILSPRDMQMTCALCHRKPSDAVMARLALDDSAAAVVRLEKALRQAKASGASVEAVEAGADAAERLQIAAEVEWHTFDMAKVLDQAREAKIRAAKALAELAARAKARP